MAICIRLNVGKLQITSRHKEYQTKHNRHCFNRIRYHVSNYHSNCEILDPRLHAPNRAAGGYSHSERQALTALRICMYVLLITADASQIAKNATRPIQETKSDLNTIITLLKQLYLLCGIGRDCGEFCKRPKYTKTKAGKPRAD